MATYGTGDTMDPEEAGYQATNIGDMAAFNDKAVRLGFLRKVYGILMAQLSLTSALIAIFFIDDVKLYTRENSYLFWLAFVVMLICLISMACCAGVRRKSPGNYVFLGIFTAAEGFLLGTATSYYKAEEVLLAVGITTILVLALTIFAFQTKIDFTAMGGILMIGLLVLILFGFFALILPSSRIVNIIYACLGAFIFSVYIIFDTQMMMGGTHKYSVSPEEYIFAALNLYLDVVNLFMYILSLVGSSSR